MTVFVEPIVGFIIELLLEQAIRHGPKAFRKARERIKMPTPELRRLFIPRSALVNRERELRTIRTTLSESSPLRLIYLSGPGGVGKTRLLEETENLAKNIKATTPIRWAGVLDLYHPDMRSVLTVQDVIAQHLDGEGEYFKNYREMRLRFEGRHIEGWSGPTLDQEREILQDLFFQDYNVFAQKYRPVLAFDTLESLATESDLIQSLCQLEYPSLAMRDWLLKQANKLNNTVVLLAGRPEQAIGPSLQRVYGSDDPGCLETITLNGLTRADSHQLLKIFLKNAVPISKKLLNQSDRLWQLTQGLPVQLALVTELIVQNKNLDLTGADKIKEADVWGRKLINTLFREDDPDTRIFFFLALARRGLTIELLYHLQPSWSKQECEEKLKNIQNLSVVKIRAGSSEIFLHDALYELFDNYSPAMEHLELWYERLADYYRDQQTKAGSDRLAWGKATVSLLYYELQRNPRQAFDVNYLHWDDIAIRGREYELDVQLRNEFLRFFNFPINQQRAALQGLTPTIIDQESAIRWVKRFVDQSNYQQAIDLAETILALAPKPYYTLISELPSKLIDIPTEMQEKARGIFEQANTFFWGQLLTYYGDALTFTGAEEQRVEDILNRGITLIERMEEKPQVWLQERVLGRAYNSLGYFLRSNGHYGKALRAYRQALSHFKNIGVVDKQVDEQATTLNNISFLLALLDDLKEAKTCVDQALAMRQALGQQYPLALSYNTRGLIYALHGPIESAMHESLFALRIFQKLESSRGMGLAYNALGYILRQQGEGWKIGRCDKRQAILCFEQAAEYLKKAARIFSEQVDEPIRLWEAFNEQGSLYGDWGYLLCQQEDTDSVEAKRTLSIQYHEEALKIAQKYELQIQMADTYDDLAQVLADQGDIDKAKECLENVLVTIPRSCFLKSGTGFDPALENGDFVWLILGKYHLQWGIWLLRETANSNSTKKSKLKNRENGIEQFAYATAYFQRYWLNHEALAPRLCAMVRYLDRNGVPFYKARKKYNDFALEYAVDLTALLKSLEETYQADR